MPGNWQPFPTCFASQNPAPAAPTKPRHFAFSSSAKKRPPQAQGSSFLREVLASPEYSSAISWLCWQGAALWSPQPYPHCVTWCSLARQTLSALELWLPISWLSFSRRCAGSASTASAPACGTAFLPGLEEATSSSVTQSTSSKREEMKESHSGV